MMTGQVSFGKPVQDSKVLHSNSSSANNLKQKNKDRYYEMAEVKRKVPVTSQDNVVQSQEPRQKSKEIKQRVEGGYNNMQVSPNSNPVQTPEEQP